VVDKKFLPESNDKTIETISNELKKKLSQAGSWIFSSDGLKISKIIASLGSFVVGEPIGFLLPFIIESSDIVIRKRFLKHFPDLVDKLQKNKDKMNLEFVRGEIGQELLRETIQKMIHETNEEKISHLKSFLINAYSKDSDEEIIKNCQKILLNMDPIHIKILSILRNPEKILRDVAEKRKQNPRSENELRYGKHQYVLYWEPLADDDINTYYLKTNPMLYENSLKDLVTWNILETVFHKRWLYFDNTFEENFQSGLRDIYRWTTPFGKQFLEFIYDN